MRQLWVSVCVGVALAVTVCWVQVDANAASVGLWNGSLDQQSQQSSISQVGKPRFPRGIFYGYGWPQRRNYTQYYPPYSPPWNPYNPYQRYNYSQYYPPQYPYYGPYQRYNYTYRYPRDLEHSLLGKPRFPRSLYYGWRNTTRWPAPSNYTQGYPPYNPPYNLPYQRYNSSQTYPPQYPYYGPNQSYNYTYRYPRDLRYVGYGWPQNNASHFWPSSRNASHQWYPPAYYNSSTQWSMPRYPRDYRPVWPQNTYGHPYSSWNQSQYGKAPYATWNQTFPRNARAVDYGGYVGNGSHNYFWGYHSPYDRLLYYTRAKKSYGLLRTVSFDLEFPPAHQRSNGTITFIQVLDQYRDGNGGYASIRRGGIGYRNVTLHFQSQFNRGIDFLVQIYGRGY